MLSRPIDLFALASPLGRVLESLGHGGLFYRPRGHRYRLLSQSSEAPGPHQAELDPCPWSGWRRSPRGDRRLHPLEPMVGGHTYVALTRDVGGRHRSSSPFSLRLLAGRTG